MTDILKTVQALVDCLTGKLDTNIAHQAAINAGRALIAQMQPDATEALRTAVEFANIINATRKAAQMQRDAVQPEFSRDDDGELLVDWAPAQGRMVSLSLRADGRLAYAFTWDGERAHGTAQMPSPEPQQDQLQQPDGHSTPSASEASTARYAPWSAKTDAEMLHTLTVEFETSAYKCDWCGHEEDLSTFDCASMLRDYMAQRAVEAQPGDQQQDDHAGSPAPSEPVATLHDDGHYTFKPGQEPWGARQAGWRMDVYAAQSSKAVLSDEDARLSEDDLHARSWWCPTCKKDVPPEMVTKDGEHYLEAGGCGYAVRGELIEDQPKQPLSDDEIHRIWMETPERPTLAEEVLAFGHTLLARAGITRKPLSALDALKIVEGHIACRADDEAWQVCLRSASALRAILDGITPQAGKESGDV